MGMFMLSNSMHNYAYMSRDSLISQPRWWNVVVAPSLTHELPTYTTYKSRTVRKITVIATISVCNNPIVLSYMEVDFNS